MTSEQPHRQYQLCTRLGLGFALVSIAAHGIERFFKADLDLGYTFLWLAVLMLAQGCLQHQKKGRVAAKTWQPSDGSPEQEL